MSQDEDRTFDPTPKRREQFRKEGKIARARDAGAVAAIGATFAIITGTKGAIVATVQELFARTLGDPGAITRGETAGVSRALWGSLFVLGVPLMIGTALATTVAGLAQAGIAPNTDLVGFKAERLDPTSRLAQLFNPKHGLFETALAMAKVLVVGGVAYAVTTDELPALLGLWAHDVAGALGILAEVAGRVLMKTLGAAALVAGADYAHSKWQLERQMKMTLKELKDEMRQEDGDPKLKAKIRSRARAIAKKRMMNDVKTASVVIANPTHVSVALRYSSRDAAPIVVAKGHDEVALAIRTRAREHGIPIVENRPLARTLDAEVSVGNPVKVEHFAAVAKILAFVFRLKRKRT
ncbi:MAG: flagellar biosynthesis protein FlhB [Polyangiaceae bacterium]|nr:flagellar biosynthesis protein FlhB [Polyangiaceae bacterium]